MALSFTASSAALTSWGFSVGDIAVIAGAGRNVGTWVMAQMKDQTLLDFLNVEPEDLIPRKGVVDHTGLHKRWDINLSLLENGRKRNITKSGAPLVNSMPIFSWFMTLVVSALDASLQLSDFRKVLTQYLSRLFAENVEGLDYLLRELPHHIQGWMSAACVRNITTRARKEWSDLAKRNIQLPGHIPSDDSQEVLRLLLWLAGAAGQQHDKTFETASSDVYALAIILEVIGFDLLKTSTTTPTQSDESSLLVIYNPTIPVIGRRINPGTLNEGRVGMRIPFNAMQECVSLWPGTPEENNFRRLLFQRGMDAADDIRKTWSLKGPQGPYELTDSTDARVGRVSDTFLYDIASSLFVVTNRAVIDEVSRILVDHPQWRPAKRASSLHYLSSDMACLTQVQIFVLGYYYALLETLLDTSQLSVKEGFGSWRWYDLGLLSTIQNIIYESSPASTVAPRCLQRSHVLKLLALLFAGAEEEQIEVINESVMGLHGKLTVIPACMLGQTDAFDSLGKFYLLDVDATAIPSNARNMIYSGTKRGVLGIGNGPAEENLCDIQKISHNASTPDFTSHIEPDWDDDVQACHIVYRYKGRIVRKFSPAQMEHAIYFLHKTRDITPAYRIYTPHHLNEAQPPDFKNIYMEGVERFFNTRYVAPKSDSSQKTLVVFPTKENSKARTCLQVIYQDVGMVVAQTGDSWENTSLIDRSKGPILLVEDDNKVRGFWGILLA